jgi:hypothetical protein
MNSRINPNFTICSAITARSISCAMSNLAGRVGRFDIRHLLPGLADRYLYSVGALDTTLPFAELRRRSNINEAARAAGNAKNFSERIRESLPNPLR